MSDEEGPFPGEVQSRSRGELQKEERMTAKYLNRYLSRGARGGRLVLGDKRYDRRDDALREAHAFGERTYGRFVELMVIPSEGALAVPEAEHLAFRAAKERDRVELRLAPPSRAAEPEPERPTQEAYEAACVALDYHRARGRALAELARFAYHDGWSEADRVRSDGDDVATAASGWSSSRSYRELGALPEASSDLTPFRDLLREELSGSGVSVALASGVADRAALGLMIRAAAIAESQLRHEEPGLSVEAALALIDEYFEPSIMNLDSVHQAREKEWCESTRDGLRAEFRAAAGAAR